MVCFVLLICLSTINCFNKEVDSAITDKLTITGSLAFIEAFIEFVSWSNFFDR